MFALSVPLSLSPGISPGFRPVPSVFLWRRKTTERISIKFAAGNHYLLQTLSLRVAYAVQVTLRIYYGAL